MPISFSIQPLDLLLAPGTSFVALSVALPIIRVRWCRPYPVIRIVVVVVGGARAPGSKQANVERTWRSTERSKQDNPRHHRRAGRVFRNHRVILARSTSLRLRDGEAESPVSTRSGFEPLNSATATVFSAAILPNSFVLLGN